MRSMMPAFLFLSGILLANAAIAQQVPARLVASDSNSILANRPEVEVSAQEPAHPSPILTQHAPEMMQYPRSSHSQLAVLMNCDPYHPNLWCDYAAQREATLAHLYRHLNGCDCLSDKRGLYASPSPACCDGSSCGKGCGAGTGCAKSPINRYKQPISTLYASPSISPTKAPCKVVNYHHSPVLNFSSSAKGFSQLYGEAGSCDTKTTSSHPSNCGCSACKLHHR